ncbi:KxYKxGKxW signal peptide domain-containing protein, partial [Streptococcus thoraltensis]
MKRKQFNKDFDEVNRRSRVKMHKSGKNWVKTVMFQLSLFRVAGKGKTAAVRIKEIPSESLSTTNMAALKVLLAAGAVSGGAVLTDTSVHADEMTDATAGASQDGTTQGDVFVVETTTTEVVEEPAVEVTTDTEAPGGLESNETSLSETQSLSESQSIKQSESLSVSESVSISESASTSLSASTAASESMSLAEVKADATAVVEEGKAKSSETSEFNEAVAPVTSEAVADETQATTSSKSLTAVVTDVNSSSLTVAPSDVQTTETLAVTSDTASTGLVAAAVTTPTTKEETTDQGLAENASSVTSDQKRVAGVAYKVQYVDQNGNLIASIPLMIPVETANAKGEKVSVTITELADLSRTPGYVLADGQAPLVTQTVTESARDTITFKVVQSENAVLQPRSYTGFRASTTGTKTTFTIADFTNGATQYYWSGGNSDKLTNTIVGVTGVYDSATKTITWKVTYDATDILTHTIWTSPKTGGAYTGLYIDTTKDPNLGSPTDVRIDGEATNPIAGSNSGTEYVSKTKSVGMTRHDITFTTAYTGTVGDLRTLGITMVAGSSKNPSFYEDGSIQKYGRYNSQSAPYVVPNNSGAVAIGGYKVGGVNTDVIDKIESESASVSTSASVSEGSTSQSASTSQSLSEKSDSESVSASTSKSASESTSTVKSESVSVSTAKSESVSTSTAKSESVSTSIAKSESVSTSTAKSESVSTSIAKSESVSTSTAKSESVSTSIAKSESVSTSTAKSESVSTSIAKSESVSTSTSKSGSTSASISASESVST